MADQDKSSDKKGAKKPEKTLGKEQAQAVANGAPADAAAASAEATPGQAIKEEVKAKAADVSETYHRARQELQDSVARLRREVSEIDVDQARQRARTWVEENPALAVALAVGAGLVIGRLLSAALTPKPPPPLSERLRMQSRRLASQAQRYAHDVGDVVSERASEAVDALARKAHDFGEEVVRRAGEVAESATERAAALGEAVAERSAKTAHALQDTARELPGAVREKASHGVDFAESLLKAARAVTAAVLVKKVTDWFRRVA